MKKLGVAALAAVGLSGCAIHQNVTPVQVRMEDRVICVIDNPVVRKGFSDGYKRALASKGYEVRTLPTVALITDCAVTSTYNATWRWDLALYMAYAEIRVFSAGKQIGEAKYDATHGSGSMGKFIDADKKVVELVDQLFPGGAGAPVAPTAATAATAASAPQ
ncbi:Sbal_3080 family lipoprotein [Roseateles chitinivorans]|uniref:Sbal_3080 family lipoprotein n=1 Tax=Roseateles chitinivorans TaxID=2917965 RepID=UPI003D67AA9C